MSKPRFPKPHVVSRAIPPGLPHPPIRRHPHNLDPKLAKRKIKKR